MKPRQTRPVLVIAGAAVDQDGMMRGFQHPGVDACDESALGFIEAFRNHHRLVLLQHLRIPVRKQKVGSEAGASLLDNLLYRYFADRVSSHDRWIFLFLGELTYHSITVPTVAAIMTLRSSTTGGSVTVKRTVCGSLINTPTIDGPQQAAPN